MQSRILVGLSRALNVTFMPPEVTIYRIGSDLQLHDRVKRRIFSRFMPVCQFINDDYIELVEPKYLQHAQPYITNATKEALSTIELPLGQFSDAGELYTKLNGLIKSGTWGKNTIILKLTEWETSSYMDWTEKEIFEELNKEIKAKNMIEMLHNAELDVLEEDDMDSSEDDESDRHPGGRKSHGNGVTGSRHPAQVSLQLEEPTIYYPCESWSFEKPRRLPVSWCSPTDMLHEVVE